LETNKDNEYENEIHNSRRVREYSRFNGILRPCRNNKLGGWFVIAIRGDKQGSQNNSCLATQSETKGSAQHNGFVHLRPMGKHEE